MQNEELQTINNNKVIINKCDIVIKEKYEIIEDDGKITFNDNPNLAPEKVVLTLKQYNNKIY